MTFTGSVNFKLSTESQDNTLEWIEIWQEFDDSQKDDALISNKMQL